MRVTWAAGTARAAGAAGAVGATCAVSIESIAIAPSAIMPERDHPEHLFGPKQQEAPASTVRNPG